MTDYTLTPHECEERAAEAEARGDWNAAAKAWRNAAGVSIGHNRRERYREAAKRCEEKAAA